MAATEKSARSRERRRMCRIQDEMLGLVNHAALLLSMIAPKKENQIGAGTVKDGNHRISKLFPATISMRSSFMRLYSECCVEEQNTLLGPATQIAMVGELEGIRILLGEFFEDVLETWWKRLEATWN